MGVWLDWRGVLRPNEDPKQFGFWCPGCKELHVYDDRWRFNGDWDRPTFVGNGGSDSLLIRSGHFVPGVKLEADGSCGWCNRAKERGRPTICRICHLFVMQGQLIYQPDCTHELARQTVGMIVPVSNSE